MYDIPPVTIFPNRFRMDTSQCYLQSWGEKDVAGVSEVIRGALEQQERLELLSTSLHGLTAASASAEFTKEIVDDVSTKLKDSASVLRELLSAVILPSFYNERHSITALPTRVQDVLELPELLETILCHLSLQDVLAMQQVSKTSFSSIQQSPRLQRKLGLRTSADGLFFLPLGRSLSLGTFSNMLPGFSCHQNGPDWTRFDYSGGYRAFALAGGTANAQEQVSVSASFVADKAGNLPVIGARYRAMVLCQPPITEMKAWAQCCAHTLWDPAQTSPTGRAMDQKKVTTVVALDGFTIGDLYDCAASMVELHRLCPDASVTCLDVDGYVQVNVRFTGRVLVRPDDPVLTHRDPRMMCCDMSIHPISQEEQERQARLQAYTIAKQTARSNSEQIPTLAMWEATQSEKDAKEPVLETSESDI